MRGAALVTGGGARVGRGLALSLAEAGYDVAIHHRGGREAADDVAGEVRAMGRQSATVAADLSEDALLSTLIARAADAVGPLTLLVNNASLFNDDRMGRLTSDGLDAHLSTNLRAPVLLAQDFAAQVPATAGDGDAMVLNILDQRVLKPNPQFFSYSLSKAGLWWATRTMAQALAPRVRVNAIGPGPTLPSVHQDEGEFEREAAATLLRRPGAPSDIAAAMRYLLDARGVTGQMIATDSGQHLAWRTPDILTE